MGEHVVVRRQIGLALRGRDIANRRGQAPCGQLRHFAALAAAVQIELADALDSLADPEELLMACFDAEGMADCKHYLNSACRTDETVLVFGDYSGDFAIDCLFAP